MDTVSEQQILDNEAESACAAVGPLEAAEQTSEPTEEKLGKYKLTLAACVMSVLTFVVAINLVPVLFVPLMNLYDLPFSHLGVLIAISFVAQTFVMIVLAKVPDKVGVRPVLIVATLLCAAGFLMMFLVPVIFGGAIFAGIVVAMVMYGTAAGFMVAMINPIVNALPIRNKERTLTLFHTSFAALMVLAILGTTLGVFFLPYESWNFVPLIWVAVPITATILWIRAPIVRPKTAKDGEAKITEGGKDRASSKATSKGIFLLLLLAMTVAMASEAIVGKGSSSYIDVGLNVPKIVGDILGPAMFAVGLGVGRLIYGLWGKKRSMSAFMIGGSAVCFVLYLVAALTPVAAIGVVALALVGLSVSLLVPGMIVATGNKFRKGGVLIFIVMAIAGKVGAAGGPALFGILGGVLDAQFMVSIAYNLGMSTQEAALRATLLLCAIFPLVSTVLQIVLRKRLRDKSVDEDTVAEDIGGATVATEGTE